MTPPGRRRRQLSFAGIEEVLVDVDRLLRGHSTVGRWSLGQICNHLAFAFSMSIDGTPHKGSVLFRRTIGPAIKTVLLAMNRIPSGVRIHSDYLPQPGLDAQREADALRAAAARYQAFTGEFDEHPMLGRFTRQQADHFHRIHCAHHLSFAIPTDDGVSACTER